MEPTNLPAKRLNETSGEDKPQIFRTLRNIDLNLLTIFEAVYVHKGIVNAAKILNLTPSAISQSIQKLRAIFPDPLFIRKGQGLTPTAYAPICMSTSARDWNRFWARWISPAVTISNEPSP